MANQITCPKVAVDAVLFAIVETELKVLLVQIGSGPYENKWAVPGGLVNENESCEQAIERVLLSKASLKNIHLEQLYTFSNPKRDSRSHSISVAYFALLPNSEKYTIKQTDYYKNTAWYTVKKLPVMAFDHEQIVATAYNRLKDKMAYSNIAYSLLPAEFTLTQLQQVYETVWGEKLDKRNFRKKIDALDLLEEVKGKKSQGAHRPAKVYMFKKRELVTF